MLGVLTVFISHVCILVGEEKTREKEGIIANESSRSLKTNSNIYYI